MEFTTEQIQAAITEVLTQNAGEINNVVNMSLFVSAVGKRLISTLGNNKLSVVERIDIIAGVGEKVTDYLEAKTLVTFELAQQFRDVLKNSDDFKNTIQSINNFVLADPEQKKTMLSMFLCNCINSILLPGKPPV